MCHHAFSVSLLWHDFMQDWRLVAPFYTLLYNVAKYLVCFRRFVTLSFWSDIKRELWLYISFLMFFKIVVRALPGYTFIVLSGSVGFFGSGSILVAHFHWSVYTSTLKWLIYYSSFLLSAHLYTLLPSHVIKVVWTWRCVLQNYIVRTRHIMTYILVNIIGEKEPQNGYARRVPSYSFFGVDTPYICPASNTYGMSVAPCRTREDCMAVVVT